MKRLIITGISCLALSALLSLNARADQQIDFSFDMPIQVKAIVNETDCDNSPGPNITLSGEILLGGLKAQLIFQNNVKGTHKATVTYATNVALVLPGGSITIPKQPPLQGAGGNPWIWIQFIDGEGNALSGEILLGRCVQGLELNKDLVNQALASTLISASGCENHPGPFITLSGGLKLSGLKAKLIFRNAVKGPHQATVTAEVELIPNGTEIVIPKQPALGGVGGNPWIWVQFLQGCDLPIGDPQFLGRCNQM